MLLQSCKSESAMLPRVEFTGERLAGLGGKDHAGGNRSANAEASSGLANFTKLNG